MSESDAMATLRLDLETYSDDHPNIRALRLPDDRYSYVDPELERIVADVIRRYPDSTAPQWLAPVAAIKAVEDWLLAKSPPAEGDDG